MFFIQMYFSAGIIVASIILFNIWRYDKEWDRRNPYFRVILYISTWICLVMVFPWFIYQVYKE